MLYLVLEADGCMLAGIPPELDMSVLLYIILGAAAGLKVLLYLYCVALQKSSETMMALAEDHRNDILSSLTAILTGAIASWWQKGWWVDPVGGILISAYIIYAWGAICKEQVPFIRQCGDSSTAQYAHVYRNLVHLYVFRPRCHCVAIN